jgi:GAF domain-containing protein
MPDVTRLHQELAKVVLVGRDLTDVLNDITKVARQAVPAPEAASITLIRGDRAFTAAYDGQMALDADELQYERGYGPCMDAAYAGELFLIDDMRSEERWPDYTRNAAEHGVGSSLSIPLPFQTATLGALNTYSSRPHAFGEDDVALGEEVAGWVALAVSNAEGAAAAHEDLSHLRAAMVSRATIEQAKGRLMERYGVTPDQAFNVLTRVSQSSQTKLRDVAADFVRTGDLPGAAGPAPG